MAEGSEQCLVLLGVDESDHSVYAFDWYVHNFHKAGNKLILVHVPEVTTHVSLMSQAKLQEHMQQWDAKIAIMQTKYMDKMKARGIDGEFVRINNEKPGTAIVDCAENRSATFVVIGTRGQGKVRRTIMGSCSDYIVHHCGVPVLLCRHKSGWEKEFKKKDKKDKKEKEKREKELRGTK